MSVIYIQALPGSGKSTFVRTNHDHFMGYVLMDGDVLFKLVYNIDLTPQSYATKLQKENLRQLKDRIEELDRLDEDYLILSNYLIPGIEPNIRIGYSPDDYIKHLKEFTGRNDLLEKFKEAELRGWAYSYTQKNKSITTVLLKPGEFISKKIKEIPNLIQWRKIH